MSKTRNKAILAKEKTSPLVHLFFILFGLACLIPFLVIVSASFSDEMDLARYGFGLIPKKFDLTAYAYLFENPKTIINAYLVTIFITVVGTFLGTLFITMVAFTLSRKNFRFRGLLTAYIFFPTLFSGGLVSSYLINTQYLHLRDNLLALILPTLINVFHVIMVRTFFMQLPESLFEAAKMDGASEYTLFFRLALPLSKPVIATVAFLGALAKWNDDEHPVAFERHAVGAYDGGHYVPAGRESENGHAGGGDRTHDAGVPLLPEVFCEGNDRGRGEGLTGRESVPESLPESSREGAAKQST